ncbi:MAG: type I restriction endonuclease [bacterium]|nr:MAG: type I restriction endonuclease [bacterium]
MERYEKYKDSGVEWIGEIPEEWEVKRFKYLFDLITDKTEDDFPKIGLENIESESGKLIQTETDFEGDGVHFKVGDILFGKLRPYLAKVYLANFQGKAIGDFFIFRSKNEISENYGSKLILSKRFIETTNGSTFGSKMPRVSWDFISNLEIAYPTIPIQTAIANYLDRKTAEIDELIAQKERLLELYEEEKTAIINQAVTKGIDPNVKLKDSGIDWLGEIPEGWEVKKLARTVKKLTNGYVGPTIGIMQSKGVPYIQGIHIKNNTINFTPNGNYYVSQEWSVAHEKSILKTNDLLVVQTGTIGDVGIVPDEFEDANCHALLIVRVNKLVFKPKYFLFLLVSQYGYASLQQIKTGEILFHINGSKLKGVDVLVPPLKDQNAIVHHIETETTRINAKIARTKQIIELQKEYRTALISEVVTGKIKVTQEAAS